MERRLLSNGWFESQYDVRIEQQHWQTSGCEIRVSTAPVPSNPRRHFSGVEGWVCVSLLSIVRLLFQVKDLFYTNTSSYELIHEASKRGPSGCALCRVDYLECRLWFADHVHARLLLLRNASNDYLTQRCIASLFAFPYVAF